MAKLNHRFGFYLRPVFPYNFELTVQKPAGWPLFTPFEIYENGILWTALHIEGMLTGLKLRSMGNTRKPLIKAGATRDWRLFSRYYQPSRRFPY